MCRYHTWFREDERGFVIECSQCGKWQVAFGMLMIRFAEGEFHSFRSYIGDQLAGMGEVENIHDKTVLLHTPCEALHFLLSWKELADLNDMLDKADTEMKMHKMLQLFEP